MQRLVDFLEEVDREQYHVAQETVRNHDAYRRAFRRAPIGTLEMGQITDADVAQFVRSRQSDGLRSGYINKLLGYLHSRLAIAASRGLVQRLPSVKAVRHQRADVDPFTPEELRRILACCAPDVKIYVELLASTGLRPCEAVALTYTDISGKGLRVNKRLNRRGQAGSCKTRHSVRTVPITPELQYKLLMMALPFEMRFYRAEGWWKDLLIYVGVEYRPIYNLRHTFASRALALGASPQQVAGWLGHSSIKQVCDVYAQWQTTSVSPAITALAKELQ